MARQEPIEIPVKVTGLAGIRNEMKSLRGDLVDQLTLLEDLKGASEQYAEALAQATDPEEIEALNSALAKNEQQIKEVTDKTIELSTAAGALKDRMAQVNEQVAIFSTGSNFEQISNTWGLMGSQLASWDFEGAGESMAILQKQISSISAEDVQKQIKGLQQVFTGLGKISGQAIMGLVKNVGGIAKAFASFGKALLTNPIFLIATAIIAIVAIIGALLSKLGLLKPVMDAIGKVFGWIGDVIDAVVQSIKDFLDWLGLTDYAAEDSAKKHTEAMEKKADAYERSSKKIIASLDEEIKINQINGEDTFKLEVRKQNVIKETAKVRLEALRAKQAENKLTNEMDAEELKALHEKITAQKELIQTANSDIRILKAQEAADDRKDAEEARKEADKNAKEAAARRKQYEQNRIAAARQATDIELSLIEDQTAREIAVVNERYRRMIEDTKRNESLLASERKRIIEGYEKQQQQDLDDIEKKRRADIKAETDEMLATMDQMKKARLERMRRDGVAERELRAMLGKEGLELELSLLNFRMEQELANTELTEKERALIEERYRLERAEKEKKAAEEELAMRRQVQAAGFELANTGLGAISNLNDLAFELKKKNLEDGSAAEEEAAKKNFETNKKIQIGMATIAGIQGVINALTAPSVLPEPIASIMRAANAVAVGISTATNIAKIRGTSYEGGGSGGGTAAGAPSGATSSAAAPAANLYGDPKQLNNLSGAKNAESANGNTFVVKAVVAADEMSAAQMVENNIMSASKL